MYKPVSELYLIQENYSNCPINHHINCDILRGTNLPINPASVGLKLVNWHFLNNSTKKEGLTCQKQLHICG